MNKSESHGHIPTPLGRVEPHVPLLSVPSDGIVTHYAKPINGQENNVAKIAGFITSYDCHDHTYQKNCHVQLHE